MKENIIVIGGYGHVGGRICGLLGGRFPGNVYAAGRSAEKAEKFARNFEGKVKPLRLDIGEGIGERLLAEARLVIMCMDQKDAALPKSVLSSGTHYLDVSANGSLLMELERLGGTARDSGATAVLSAGLAPGLTNLLARRAVMSLDKTEAIAISIMLGLGDDHGKAAVEWMLDSIGSSYEVMERGKAVPVRCFKDGRKADFGGGLGVRTAYRYPFPDQLSLPRTLNVPDVSTRLCFDSRAATAAAAAVAGPWLAKLLKRDAFRGRMLNMIRRSAFGSDVYAICVEGYGVKDGIRTERRFVIQGREEAEATAAMAAAAAELIYVSALPAGVFHSEQVFALEPAGGQLRLRASARPGIAEAPILARKLRLAALMHE